MNSLDEQILRAYFRMEEAQRQRLWMERLLHPEKFNWQKQGTPPPISRTKMIRIEELARLGFGEAHYQAMTQSEAESKKELEDLARSHPLWTYFEHLKGFGPYLCGAFIAASGDIERTPTVSAFWKGMGLDLLPDGTVPRRVRGRKDVERRIPALPHVTRIGEQIRTQMLRGGGKLKGIYDRQKEGLKAKYPDRAKLFNHKGALRNTQKILYSCLWREWRLGRGLPAPEPYAFSILKHDSEPPIRIEDFYDR